MAEYRPSSKAYDASTMHVFSLDRHLEVQGLKPPEECEAWDVEDMLTCSCEACYLYRENKVLRALESKIFKEEMARMEELSKLPIYSDGYRKAPHN